MIEAIGGENYTCQCCGSACVFVGLYESGWAKDDYRIDCRVCGSITRQPNNEKRAAMAAASLERALEAGRKRRIYAVVIT